MCEDIHSLNTAQDIPTIQILYQLYCENRKLLNTHEHKLFKIMMPQNKIINIRNDNV